QINDPIQPGAEQILLPGLLSLPRPHRSPSLDHLEGKESQPPIRRNRKDNLQENRSAAAQFWQKPLLGKAQSPISFNALEILHGRRVSKTERLAAALLADRERPTIHHKIIPCLVCAYKFVYRGKQGELNGRFCSMRCQDWYGAGNK